MPTPAARDGEPSPALHLRADGRRNYERIVAAASALVAEHGADASLEQVARRAQVGSATLHRHFPTRRALLEAVFFDRVLALSAEARRLAASTTPDRALLAWLEVVTRHGVTTRGLATALLNAEEGDAAAAGRSATCEQMLIDACAALVREAQRAGQVRPDITAEDVLSIVVGLCVAVGDGADAPESAVRLLHLTLTGIAAVL